MNSSAWPRKRDPVKVQRAFNDMKDKFGGTVFATQGALLAARLQQEAGKLDEAKAALAWVADEASDPAYQAIARLRLAALLAQAKDYPAAMARLEGAFPAEFQPLVADRKGDLLMLQDKPAEARAQYQTAWAGLGPRSEYRRLVEIKLTALGADPRPVRCQRSGGRQEMTARRQRPVACAFGQRLAMVGLACCWRPVRVARTSPNRPNSARMRR